MTAPPDSTPAGLPPAGRCDGIAGDAETTTGPPTTFTAAFAEYHDRGGDAPILTYCELETALAEARRFAVALESEVAALTDALAAMTHEHEPAGRLSTEGPVHVIKLPICARCGLAADAHLHRTPARVRAELEGGR